MSGLALGRTTHHIAKVCGVTNSTVRQQALSARRRLGCANKDEAILIVRQGWPMRRKQYAEAEKPLSLTMKAYLAAFDRMILGWRDDGIVIQAKREMDHLLAAELTRKRIRIVRDRRLQSQRTLKHEMAREELPAL